MRRIISVLLILFTALSVLAVSASASTTVCEYSPEESFLRLHIRANSDSETDQELKLNVRDSVLAFIKKCFDSGNISTKTDAMDIIEKNLNEINALAKKTLFENSCISNIECRIGREYFPDCEYEGAILPAGDYDSLIIEIGEGVGHNWWCVLFSSNDQFRNDCTYEDETALYITDLETVEKVRYEFWIVNIMKELFPR